MALVMFRHESPKLGRLGREWGYRPVFLKKESDL